MVVPHGSSVYSYHFVVTRTNSPFAEFLMMHPTAEEVLTHRREIVVFVVATSQWGLART